MGSTPRHGIRYPDGGNPVLVPRDMKTLGSDVDNLLPLVQSAAPPQAPGLLWRNPDDGWVRLSDGSNWTAVSVPPVSYSDQQNEVSVAAANVSPLALASPTNLRSYYTVAGGVGTVRVAGVWALSLMIAAQVTGDLPLGGAITTPARNAWDGRTYTGHWVDWNSITRGAAAWSGFLDVGEQFGFLRANHDSGSRAMSSAYTIAFCGVG